MKNSNGYGSVFKLGGKRRKPYAVRVTAGWTDTGKQIFKYIGYYEKKPDAMIALAEFNKNPYNLDLNNITFREIFDKWKERKYPTLSESRQKGYNSAYKKCKVIENKLFKDLRKMHLQTVVDQVEAFSMQENVKHLYGHLYRYALENDIVQKDYSKFIEVKKKDKKKEKIPFSQIEIDHLWKHAHDMKNADIALILLYTGLRIGELLDMEKDRIFLNDRYMRTAASKTEAGENRIVPIHKRIVPLIEKHLNDATNETNYLLVNRNKMKIQYSAYEKRNWKPLMEKLYMKHTLHETRHTFITRMKLLDVDDLKIKRIVGHSDSNVTENYIHLELDDLIKEIDKLD